MKRKSNSTLLFEYRGLQKQYKDMLQWEEETKGNLIVAKLTAPQEPVSYYIFRFDKRSGSFSILANSLAVHTSYDRCFTYSKNIAYLSWHNLEKRLYHKGNVEARKAMLQFLISKKFKNKIGLDFLQEQDLPFVSQSLPLIHHLFARNITSQLAAWKYYLKNNHRISGNINYKLLNEIYRKAMIPCRKRNDSKKLICLLFKMLYTADNPQRALNIFFDKKGTANKIRRLEPLINNASIMQKKINYNVSDIKIKDILSKQMDELLQIRIKAGLISVEPINAYLPAKMVFFSANVQFSLLNNMAAFELEGAEMRNCIFKSSNYVALAKSGRFLYFSVKSIKDDRLRGTLEVCIEEVKPELREFKSKMNQIDFLHRYVTKMHGIKIFLQTTRDFITGEEMCTLYESINMHFKKVNEQF